MSKLDAAHLPQKEVTEPPRLWDFKLLRLALPEVLIIVLLITVVIMDLRSTHQLSGLLTYVLYLPLMFFMVIALALVYPLATRPVNEFIGDVAVLGVGLIGLAALLSTPSLYVFLLGVLPVALSTMARRLIAFMRWKNGSDPRLPKQQEES